ncbi:MAG TPA: MFS transporter, partial [Candidatus Binataceae bacterium]|nr:MFS transporter [Candidatus Binataceae bacterium]
IGKPEEAPARRDRRGVARDIVEGARFLVDDPRLLAIALSAAMASIANGIMSALYMLYFVNELGFAPGPLGMIFATGGGAALIGAAFAPRIADRIGIWPAMALGLAGMGAGYGLITLAHGAGPSSVALLVAQQLLGDSAGTVYFVLSTTLLQRIAPQHIIGRVVAGMKFLGLAAFLLASLGGGFLGQAIGFRTSLVIAAVALMAGAAIAAPMREGTAAERAAV